MEWDHREVAVDPENKKSIPKLSQVLDANTYDMQLYIYPKSRCLLVRDLLYTSRTPSQPRTRSIHST